MRKLLLAFVFCALAYPAQAATMYWSSAVTGGGGASCTNGTYNWDSDSGTAGAAHKCWATTTGGTTAAAEPSTSDTAAFDANSGSGTITVNQNIALASLSTTNFGGTLDFSVNNNTFSGSTWSSGAGTQTINMGSNTWSVTCSLNSGSCVTLNNASLTLNAGTSTLVLNATNTSGVAAWNLGGKTFSTVTLTTSASGILGINGSNTIGTLNCIGPAFVTLLTATTQTISTAMTLTGSSGNMCTFESGTIGTNSATIAVPAGASGTWVALRDVTFSTNAPTFTNCINLGHVALNGGSCAAPNVVAGGGGTGIIGE